MKQLLIKMTGEEEVPKDLILLLAISGLYFLGIALSNVFVNVYIWKHTQSLLDIGLYNLMIAIFQPLSFWIAGRWAKQHDRVLVLRVGVIILAAFFISVLAFGSHIHDYLLLFGALIGTGYGFYWLSFNVLTFEITEPETRDFFNGFQGVLSAVAGMIGPLTSGFIISTMSKFHGYRVIFVCSLVLFALAVVCSFFINKRPDDSKTFFKSVINERIKNASWRAILNAHFFQGLREGTFMFVIGIWVYLATKSELSLGKFGLVESLVLFIGYFLAGRLIKPPWRRKAIIAGSLVLYFAVFLIVFKLNFPLLMTYAVLTSLAYPFLLVPYMSLTFDVIGKGRKAGEWRIEYIVIREMFYNSGRVVSICLFLLTVKFFGSHLALRLLLIIIGCGHVLIYFCVRQIDLRKVAERRKISRQFIEE